MRRKSIKYVFVIKPVPEYAVFITTFRVKDIYDNCTVQGYMTSGCAVTYPCTLCITQGGRRLKICKSEDEYLNQIIEPVRRCCKRYGYLPSVLIAQSCLENGYGIPSYWDNPQIEALMTYNNMVGIKVELLSDSWTNCGLSVWPGERLRKKTPEVYGGVHVVIDDDFRKYDSIEQSFADFLCFMTWGSNYGKGGTPKYGQKVLTIKNPRQLIETVRALGYATDPKYPDKAMDIVNKHCLTQYDDLTGVEPTAYVPESKKENKVMAKVEKPVIIDRITANLGEVPAHNANSHQYLAIHYLGVNGENPDLYGGGYGGHFYVSKTGVCYQAARVTDKLWHVGASSGFKYVHPYARNTNTIGIECGTYSVGSKWYFTEATQEACAHLAAWIMSQYGIPMENLLRHGDITTKHCPSPYVDNPGDGSNWTWQQFKAKVKSYLDGAESEDTYMVEFEKVHMGSSGADVKTLQTMLYAMGFVGADGQALGVDGDFGKNTDFAVREFQKINNLEVDGWCGPLTWAKLFGKG